MRIRRTENYQHNDSLIAEIHEIIAPSYKEAGSHITKDIERCPILYTINSSEGKIIALFMIGYHNIDNMKTCYMGLSACREEYKNQGLAKLLYLEALRDCNLKEAEINQRIICYWTTATPIAYHVVQKIFQDAQPDHIGNCTPEAQKIISAIARANYPDVTVDATCPYLLRHAAHNINYSEEEKERIKKAARDLNLEVFDRYKLDETQGDRFLMIGYAPTLDSQL
jgi:hypothetical protein